MGCGIGIRIGIGRNGGQWGGAIDVGLGVGGYIRVNPRDTGKSKPGVRGRVGIGIIGIGGDLKCPNGGPIGGGFVGSIGGGMVGISTDGSITIGGGFYMGGGVGYIGSQSTINSFYGVPSDVDNNL